MTDPTEKGDVAPIERVLAGDLGSPLEVLASDTLSDTQKREVLETWRRDLERRGGRAAHGAVIASIEEALARLGA